MEPAQHPDRDEAPPAGSAHIGDVPPEEWRQRMKPYSDASPAVIARLILKRAGITPLLPAIGVALFPRPAHPATDEEQGNGPKIEATAQVQIVSANAQIRGGHLSSNLGPASPAGVDPRRPVNGVSRLERDCVAEPQPTATPAIAAPNCHITIYDLP